MDAAPALPPATLCAVLVEHFRAHTLTYLLAALFFLSANLTAIADAFATLNKPDMAALGWWQVAALVAKALNAGCVAVIALLTKSPLPSKPSDKP